MIDNSERMQVVFKTRPEPAHLAVQFLFTGVREWGMADVVRKRQRFRELLVQAEHRGHRSRDLGHFKGVRQAISKVVAKIRREDLGFALEASKTASMYDAIAVALILIPVWMGKLGILAASRGCRR